MEILKLEYNAHTQLVRASVPEMREVTDDRGVTSRVVVLSDKPHPTEALTLDEIRAANPAAAEAFEQALTLLEPIFRAEAEGTLADPKKIATQAALNAHHREEIEAKRRELHAETQKHLDVRAEYERAVNEAAAKLAELNAKIEAAALPTVVLLGDKPTPDLTLIDSPSMTIYEGHEPANSAPDSEPKGPTHE